MTLESYKTKTVAQTLANIGADKKALVVYADADKVLVNSTRNIAGVKVAGVNTINTYDILNADKLVIVKDAVAKLEEVYA
jgi:large subunit ribosomal protein L4